jgi:anti-sigma B factor antagonist
MADFDDTPQLTVTTKEDAGGIPLICVAGELDLATAPKLSAAARAALDQDRGRVVFDLSELTFMDSSGLRVLLEVANEATVSVRDASPAVRRVIESTGVDSVLQLES